VNSNLGREIAQREPAANSFCLEPLSELAESRLACECHD
jgi:hypothetical protein